MVKQNSDPGVEGTPQIRSQSGRANYLLIGAVIGVLAILAAINLKSNQPVASPLLPTAPELSIEPPLSIPVGTDPPRVVIDEEPPELLLISEQPKKMADLTDTECSQMSVGTWTSESDGERILTIRGDGTATMIYRPSQLKQLILGEKVTIEIAWKIEDHTVIFNSISGAPDTSFKTITALYGRKMERKLLQISATAFTVQDLEDNHETEWERITPPAEK